MSTTRRRLLIALIIVVAAPWPGAAQTTAGDAALSPAEMERFLLVGKILKKQELSKGVTDAYRVTLTDGVVTHDAHVQNVDEAKPLFSADPKYREVNFKDSYRYNIAAYRVATLLGLDNVPMSVERMVDGRPAAVTWWLDDAMDDVDREKKKVSHSNSLRASEYFSLMFVFDELIQNRDRNRGNILWSPDSRMWMIDHTRAFRLGKDLLKQESLTRVERNFFEKLRALDRSALTTAVGKTLTKQEIEALFERRDRLVKLFDEKIAALGESKVLYSIR